MEARLRSRERTWPKKSISCARDGFVHTRCARVKHLYNFQWSPIVIPV